MSRKKSRVVWVAKCLANPWTTNGVKYFNKHKGLFLKNMEDEYTDNLQEAYFFESKQEIEECVDNENHRFVKAKLTLTI